MPNNKHFHNESKYLLKINITNLKMMFEIQPVVKSPHIEPNRNIILCACHNLELIYQPALFLSIFFIKNLQILLPVLRKFKFRFSSQWMKKKMIVTTDYSFKSDFFYPKPVHTFLLISVKLACYIFVKKITSENYLGRKCFYGFLFDSDMPLWKFSQNF